VAKKEEVSEELRTLHEADLHGEVRQPSGKCIRDLVGKPED